MNPKDRSDSEDWHEWRERRGSVGRESESFFAAVWEILHHCRGLMIGEKLNRKRRLDSEDTLAQMTAGEQSFVLRINHLLDKVQSPDYRQLNVETLFALASIFRDNPELYIDDTLLTDIIIGHAVRLSWISMHPERSSSYNEDRALAWQAFYQLAPHQVANGILDALKFLLNQHA